MNPPSILGRAFRGLVLLGLSAADVWAADDAAAPRPRYSPTQRMAPARLKAAHDDVTRIQAARHPLPPLGRLNDYRTILHAHAEDSAHTGGTRPEMLADAKQAGVHAILLTDHYRPPRDFITDSWRGTRDGVLFIPGSEIRGFLIYPSRSIMARMDEPTPAFIETVRDDGGLIFLSHIEERPDHPMAGLDGMEIYNRHADAKKDAAGLLNLTLKLTDPASLAEFQESLKLYPAEVLAAQQTYPADYLAKWDAETTSRRLTGVAANDCHHNMVLLVTMIDDDHVRVGLSVDADEKRRTVPATLRPGIRALTKGHKPGDELARVDLDPYRRSFLDVSTHVLAPALDEPSVRKALREGHAYVSHDWMCDPTGFHVELTSAASPPAILGDEVSLTPGSRIKARSPVPCKFRLMEGGRPVTETTGDRLDVAIDKPGVYRVEAWLTVDGEDRGWVYANPIYVRPAAKPSGD